MENETQYLANRYPSLGPALATVMPGLNHYRLSPTCLQNQSRVLKAFVKHKVDSYDLAGSTGYGYNDSGRDKLEAIYAQVFDGEAALVRPQIASGTHALWLALSGNTGPGDQVISISGPPYATLATVLADEGLGSFQRQGIGFKSIDLLPDGSLDLETLGMTICSRTKIIFLQRSIGYAWRRSLGIQQIGALKDWLLARGLSSALVVDNCYGEFVEDREPGAVGADLVVGSLIKNPGGGIAETGGYLVGRRALVENACNRLLAPGLAGEIGATGPYLRSMFQGLFLAPHFVGEAVYNARFAAALAEQLGLKTLPRWDDERHDIVQAIELGSAEAVERFCRAIQANSPVDSHATPVPDAMPGYPSPVIMAAGAFVQGASLELSADGPMEPPYIVYFQGGLSAQHGMLAICAALAALTP